MKNYYRIMLGRKSVHSDECHRGGFLGADYNIDQDLAGKLPDDWRSFNRTFIPLFLTKHPDKGKIAAGLACGALWTVAKGIKKGDVVISPIGSGSYLVGEVSSDYSYHAGEILPHRRAVIWYDQRIDRADMSPSLKSTTNSGTDSNITKYADELENLIQGQIPDLIATDDTVEDPTVFALEQHLEDFLVANWSQTELGKDFEIFQEDGEIVGQQYPTDTGPIDILAISKDNRELLVVELKKGRASDRVVGQIQRYMGYVMDVLAEEDQRVKGVIIALEDDLKLQRSLSVTQNIEFYKYQITFNLSKD